MMDLKIGDVLRVPIVKFHQFQSEMETTSAPELATKQHEY